MKRYTLIFSFIDTPSVVDSPRELVENILLHLHPRIIYKIGRVTATGDRRLVAEVSVDKNETMFEALIKIVEGRSPLTLKTVRWGWVVDDPPDPTSGITILNLDRNPFADLPAQDVPTQFKFNNKNHLHPFYFDQHFNNRFSRSDSRSHHLQEFGINGWYYHRYFHAQVIFHQQHPSEVLALSSTNYL
ncbi:MAG: hypothetical protein WBV22_05260 [Anaerolineaceae bacterium]